MPSKEEDALDLTPLLRSKLAWDMLECEKINELWDDLELVRPSEDVADLQHTESHERMAQLQPIWGVGEVYSVLCADLIYRLSLHDLREQAPEAMDLVDDDTKKKLKAQIHTIVRSAVFPVIAHMLENDYLRLGASALSPFKVVSY